MRITLKSLLALSACIGVGVPLGNAEVLDLTDYLPSQQGSGSHSVSSDPDLLGLRPDSFPSARAASALANVKPDEALSTRGAKEAQIYRTLSPSVVLVVTDRGLGSGSVITNGVILTSFHVVEGAKHIGVIFKPAQEGQKVTEANLVRAELVKFDAVTDLAILNVTGGVGAVKPIDLGAQSDIEVGADVHAIGHPTGEMWTYTRGIISQYRKDYLWTDSEDKKKHEADVIQTQTPLNPGNSGGPLIANSGKLIGVNAFITQGAEGLNFAVSISTIRAFIARPDNQMPPKPKEPCLIYKGRDKENTANIRLLDTDCVGKANVLYRTPDDPNRSMALLIDVNRDGKPDVWIYDWNRDGKWDYSLQSSKRDGHIDLIGYHTNGSVEATRYEPYRSQPTPWAN